MEPLHIVGRNVKWCNCYRKQFGSFSELNRITQGSATPLLGIYPKELKTQTQISIHTLMCIVALITIAKKVEKTQCPSNEWTEKCDTKKIHTHDEILSSLKKEWNIGACYNMMNLKNIMLSKGSQRKRSYHLWFYLHDMSRTGKFIEKEYRLAVARVWGKREIWRNWLINKRFYFAVMEKFEN